MTKEEQNQIIKDAWIRNLQKENDIPSNIGDIYRNWVLGLIQQANSMMGTNQQNKSEMEQEAS